MDCILSLLNQEYADWELFLINDGSVDNSKNIALSFNDSRIFYLEQENKGVSSARNLGLEKMKGHFFCFLDADDVLTSNSLSSRLKLFQDNRELEFVDGAIQIMDSNLQNIEHFWQPSFSGNPLLDLIHLTGNSFSNPSWMIKRIPNKTYKFHEKLTHGEDLLFYMELVKDGGSYDYVSEPILKYRNTPGSAMKNLEALERGYRYIEKQISKWHEVSQDDLRIFKYRYKRSMLLSYLRCGKLYEGAKLLLF